MKMVDLKKTAADKKEAEKRWKEGPSIGGGEEYPSDMQLRLDKGSMKKLGMTVDKLKVGDTVEISGTAKIVSTHKSAGSSGEDEHARLQLTHLGVEHKPAKTETKKPLADAPMAEYAARRKMGEKA